MRFFTLVKIPLRMVMKSNTLVPSFFLIGFVYILSSKFKKTLIILLLFIALTFA